MNSAEVYRTSVRHKFVQLLMATGYMDKKFALSTFMRLVEGASASVRKSITLESVIVEQNKAMSSLGFSIRLVRGEHDGRAYIAFVNTVSDTLAKGVKAAQDWHVSMFKAIFSKALETDGSLSTADIISLRSGSKPRQDEWMEHAKQLVREGWLATNNAGTQWFLGPRTLAEFHDSLRDRTGECVRCGEPVVYGTVAASDSADDEAEPDRIHYSCLHPEDAEVWQPEHKLTYEQLANGGAVTSASPSQLTQTQVAASAAAAPGKRRRASAKAAAEEDDDDEVAAPAKGRGRKASPAAKTETATKAKPARGRAATKSAKKAEEDEDEEEDEDPEDIDDEEERPTPKAKAGRKPAAAAAKSTSAAAGGAAGTGTRRRGRVVESDED